MNRQLIALALIWILQGSQARAAEAFSGNEMLRGCQNHTQRNNNSDPYGQGICMGVVANTFYYRSRFDVCTPAGSNVGQAIRIVTRYLDTHPARTHEDFRKLVVEALQEAWPCTR